MAIPDFCPEIGILGNETRVFLILTCSYFGYVALLCAKCLGTREMYTKTVGSMCICLTQHVCTEGLFGTGIESGAHIAWACVVSLNNKGHRS